MSTGDNDGLFDKIKKNMDLNHIKAIMGQQDLLNPEQQAQLRELFKTENDKYKKSLKQKYQSVAKSVVERREKELLEKFKQELIRIKSQNGDISESTHRQQKILAATWHAQVAALQKELDQQKALVKTSIDQGMLAGREIGLKQAEEKYSRLLSERANEFHGEYARLSEKEQALKQNFHIELKKQEALLNSETMSKMNLELAKIHQKHTVEMEQLRAAYNAKIAELETNLNTIRPDIEANKLRMRAEIEAELQTILTHKFEDAKQQLSATKNHELQSALIVEKQKLVLDIEQENVVVLKYKEREIRDQFNAELAHAKAQIRLEIEQDLRESLLADFQIKLEQEKASIIAEMTYKQQEAVTQERVKLEQEKASIIAEMTYKQQDSVTQERIKLNSQHANETKILLQQNQDTMITQHQADLTIKLDELSNKLKKEHKKEIDALEYEHNQIVTKAVATREHEIKFQYQLDDIDQHKANLENEKREEMATFEKQLRKEFQDLLIQQRNLANEKFAQQRAQEIQKALVKYKDQIEDQIKDEYADKWQQHSAMLKSELDQKLEQELSTVHKDLAKQKLIFLKEQEQKLEKKMHQQLADNIEQERKKLGVKFAQYKSALIKDLGNKFNHEKQLAIQNYEEDLRDTLYKEMVRQKEHIQAKFIKGQEAALLEQKRRLEAEHQQKLERVKQEVTEKKDANDFSQAVINTRVRHNPVAIERGMEQLADRILAKFNSNSDNN